MSNKAVWLSVAGAKPTPGSANFRKTAEQHDAKANGTTGGRRFKFIRQRSKVGQLRTREYAVKAAAFVAAAVARGERCPVFAAFDDLPAKCCAMLIYSVVGNRKPDNLSENHHTKGRAGSLLMDERHWLAVSKWGHRVIHAFPAEARAHGWICEKGAWNVPDRSVA